MPAPRLLIVEDEFLIRITLAEALADEAFEVLEAGSADEALAILHHSPVALLLTDIRLSGALDGFALAEAARKTDPGLPVIFTSGGTDAAQRERMTARDAFIAKPYLPSDVCALVRRMMAEASPG